eukprot:2855390-Pyramimonas_sp.AAC.1
MRGVRSTLARHKSRLPVLLLRDIGGLVALLPGRLQNGREYSCPEWETSIPNSAKRQPNCPSTLRRQCVKNSVDPALPS